MTKLQTENLVCDLIKFLKKWGLWKGTEIFACFGKRYADSADAAAGEWGFRDMPDVHVSESDRHKSLDEFCEKETGVEPPSVLWISCFALHELTWRSNLTIYLPQCSPPIRKFIIEAAGLLCDMPEDFEASSILDDTEFDSHNEYLALEMEMRQELEGSYIKATFGDFCEGGTEVAKRVIRELDALAERHGVFWMQPIVYSDPIAFWECENGTA